MVPSSGDNILEPGDNFSEPGDPETNFQVSSGTTFKLQRPSETVFETSD